MNSLVINLIKNLKIYLHLMNLKFNFAAGGQWGMLTITFVDIS